jgi:hypothetical protein
MLFQVLRTLEALSALAGVWLERNMNPNMACNVIPFSGFCSAVSPTTCQTQIIRRFASDMVVGAVILNQSV